MTLTVLSSLPETRRVASREKASALTAPRCPCTPPGHQCESQNATFRFVVLNECALPEESQPFVLSTSAMNPISAFPRPRRVKLIMRLVTAIPGGLRRARRPVRSPPEWDPGDACGARGDGLRSPRGAPMIITLSKILTWR